MQGIKSQLMPRPTVRTASRVMILVAIMSVFAGCASIDQPKSEAVVTAPAMAAATAVPAGPSVSRLPDGREGFVIMEAPSMDAGSRRDFEHALELMKNQDYEKAIGLLEKVAVQSPGVSAPLVNLAIAYRHLDKLPQAEQHLKTALELVPEHPVASNEYGYLLRKTGRFAEARTIYEKTLAAFPDYYPAHRSLGILCDLYLNDQVCALEHYEIYCEAMPKDEQVKMWVADLRARLKR